MFPLLTRSKIVSAAVLSLLGFSTASAQSTITIDATKQVRSVDDRLFGVNTAVWDGHFNDPQTVQLLKASDMRALRFPGGSTADTYNWQTRAGYDQSFNASFDDFATTAVALHASAYITINYGSGTVQLASDWVKYSNVTKSYAIKYWEIGNENYGSWEMDTHPVGKQWDPVTYATEVKDYITAMKAIDPTIKIGVVAEATEDALDAKSPPGQLVTNPRTGVKHAGWTPVMLTTLKSLGVTPDFLIYHRYDGSPGSESDSGLLQAAKTWPTDAGNLRQMLTDYLGAAGAAVELDVTENNSVYGSPGKQSVSLVNALYLADSTAEVLQTEFNSLLWWDLRNGQETTNNNSATLYGWRQYGDYGIIDPSNNPYPTYYVDKLLSHFARGGDVIVPVTSNNNLLAAYAAEKADGTLAVLVINKSPATTTTANLVFTGFAPSTNGVILSYGIPQDNAAQTGTGSPDLATTPLTGASASFSATFAPYSASVIILAPAAPVIVTQPGNQDVAAGAAATFSVGTMGSDTITYQWNFNGSPIAGATGNSYTISNVQTANVGSYTVTVANASGSIASGGAWLTITGAQLPATSARLVNLSTRATVGTGANVVISGFVIGGASSGTKQVLLRGEGPALGPQGVADFVAQPTLSLYDRQPVLVASNTGWSTASNAGSIASTATTVGAYAWPSGSADSALLSGLAPSLYTVQIADVAGKGGVALAEIYEADVTDAFPLVNISTRAFVGTGADIMIAGFVIKGTTPARVLIRANGPLLTSLGVPGALLRPAISVIPQLGKIIASNQKWILNPSSDQIASVSKSVGAYPYAYGSADCSLYLTLNPGVYTALVTGANNTTGVALVEVYLVP